MQARDFILCAIAATAFAAASADAGVMLNWDQADAIVPTGTLSFDGTRLRGTNISLDLMQASGTAADGTYHCSDAGGSVVLGTTRCLLSFETGPLQSQLGPVYLFGPGGSIVLAGWLTPAGPGNTAPVISGNPLVLSGSFAGIFTFNRSASGLGQGAGFDEKDLTLSEFFGLEQLFRFATTQIALGGCTSGETFTCAVTQADFQNTQIPEPASLGLLGLGLLGLGLRRGWRRD